MEIELKLKYNVWIKHENNFYFADFEGNKLNIISLQDNQQTNKVLEIKLTPHVVNSPSSTISSICFFLLPSELVSSPCLAVGLHNGCFYLLTVDGRVLFLYCGFQSRQNLSQLCRIQHIISTQSNIFTTAYALGFKDSELIALVTMNSLIQSIQRQFSTVYYLKESLVPTLSQQSVLFGQKQFSTQISINFIVLKRLSPQIPFKNAKFLLENTNIILISPRPFLCKLVPFSHNEVGEVQAPSYIVNQLKMAQNEIPDGSTITIQGEEFDYIVSKNDSQVYISTFYKG